MIKAILQHGATVAGKHPSVLCSVVQWKGSVPRKDFPMMLVLEDGSVIGTIGGGSMEHMIAETAVQMLQDSSEPQLFDFDMTGTDVNADVGLCGGTVKVLVEPFTESIASFYKKMLAQAPENRKLMVRLIVDGGDANRVTRTLIESNKDISELDPALQDQIKKNFDHQQSRAFRVGDKHHLLWQPFSTPRIHIFGAGHVGQSVAALAHFNGLTVQVYDDRPDLLTEDRFPNANRIEMAFPINWDKLPAIEESAFVLIASRKHKHDRELLMGLLKVPLKYVGLVSSTRKWRILAESLVSSGFDSASVSRVHAPVGLDIAAQTVPEIAISIMSEMIREYRKI
ncbi:XdhC family protein [bacterium]|nr:XdhC family protein [bacterium]